MVELFYFTDEKKLKLMKLIEPVTDNRTNIIIIRFKMLIKFIN